MRKPNYKRCLAIAYRRSWAYHNYRSVTESYVPPVNCLVCGEAPCASDIPVSLLLRDDSVHQLRLVPGALPLRTMQAAVVGHVCSRSACYDALKEELAHTIQTHEAAERERAACKKRRRERDRGRPRRRTTATGFCTTNDVIGGYGILKRNRRRRRRVTTDEAAVALALARR